MSEREHAPTPDEPVAPTETTSPGAPTSEEDTGAARDADDADGAQDTGAAPDAGEADGPEDTGSWAELAEDPRSPEELRLELAEAESRRDEYLEDVRRARAEFENYRKRTAREASTVRLQGRADVAEALLDVLDDLDRTRAASEGSADPALAKAVDLIAEKVTKALRDQGLERVDATGVTFDPEVHEAVQQVDADPPVDEPQVHQVLRPGYRFGERTLRAAMVVVAG